MNKRIWLITGISSGIGKSIAETVILKGDFVIGTFRNQSQATEFTNLNLGSAKGIVLDLANNNSITSAVENIKRDFLKIDILVNNAGVGITGAIEETSLDEVRQVFEVNVFGTLALTQLILPIMRSQKSGYIIQISSHAGIKAFAGFGIYNSSKFALEGFSEALAHEIKSLGIGLTIVEPGPFRTNFAGNSLIEAKKTIPDYSETAGAFRLKLKGVHNKQEGNPLKAAKAIIKHIDSDHPTLRLALGKIPLITIAMKIKSLQEDLEANRLISESTVYTD